MPPVARLVLGLLAGLVTVYLIDRYLWPGTLTSGAIGVIVAIIVLGLLGRHGSRT